MSFSPSIIGSTTCNRGNVGSTSIRTERLRVSSGGTLSSATLAAGDTGTTSILASSIEVTGTGKIELVAVVEANHPAVSSLSPKCQGRELGAVQSEPSVPRTPRTKP